MNNRFQATIFNQEELEAAIQREKNDRTETLSYNKSQHSLDSDEEDDKEKAEKYNVLDPNDLEGQEDGTLDFDGEIKITPFNMKEELEEGYFDKEGTYIFQKDDDLVKDQWLDDIDWIKVKATEASKRKPDDEDEEDSEDERPLINLVDKYTQMIELMKPGECVQKAIRRLGGNKASWSASSRWKKKKESAVAKETECEPEPEKLQLLTSLADEIIHSGDMDVYQQTYEKMSFYLNSKSAEKSKLNGAQNLEPASDMFGDDFEESVDENKVSEPAVCTPSPTTETIDNESEVMWEFKWEADEDAKVYGPYPTSQMQQWVSEKYFEDGVLVRQLGKQNAEFYSSKRIDFELYL